MMDKIKAFMTPNLDAQNDWILLQLSLLPSLPSSLRFSIFWFA
jgi:hypothetical protein